MLERFDTLGLGSASRLAGQGDTRRNPRIDPRLWRVSHLQIRTALVETALNVPLTVGMTMVDARIKHAYCRRNRYLYADATP